MFRRGSKNGHTVYWSAAAEPADRFVCAAMTPVAAGVIAIALNKLYSAEKPTFVADLPAVPKREGV